MSIYYEMNGNILPQVRLVDKAVLEPPYVHKERQVDEYILYIMLKGELYLRENGINYVLREGDVILLDPEYTHKGLKASRCEYFYVHLKHPQIKRRRKNSGFVEKCLRVRSESLQEDGGSWQRYQDSWINFPKYMSLKTGKTFLKVVQLIREAIEQNRNQLENYKVACACKLMEAMVTIAREANSTEALKVIPGIPQSYRRVHELLAFLNTNYAKDISSRSIEEEFSCNFDHMNRVFKKTVGKTIFSYLNEIRIQHAKELIGTTSMKMAVIGYCVGIQDESYFNKVFKKYTGVSPGQYEKMTYHLTELQQKPM